MCVRASATYRMADEGEAGLGPSRFCCSARYFFPAVCLDCDSREVYIARPRIFPLERHRSGKKAFREL